MLDLRELLNVTYAAFSAIFGRDKVDELLAPDAEVSEQEPARVVAQNREWLASLRASGVPLPKVPS